MSDIKNAGLPEGRITQYMVRVSMGIDHKTHRLCRDTSDGATKRLTLSVAASGVDHGDTSIADNETNISDGFTVKHHGMFSRPHIYARGNLYHLGAMLTLVRRHAWFWPDNQQQQEKSAENHP
jgi:hypothetical protein